MRGGLGVRELRFHMIEGDFKVSAQPCLHLTTLRPPQLPFTPRIRLPEQQFCELILHTAYATRLGGRQRELAQESVCCTAAVHPQW